MANSNVSALTALLATEIDGTADLLYIWDDSLTGINRSKKITLNELAAFAQTGIVEADIADLQSYLLDITAEALSTLSDVTITTIATGEILKWNGTAWINNTLNEAGISATGHSHTASDVTDFDTEVGNNTAVAANTAKTGITAQQASDITANNAKVTYDDAAAVAANTAKVTNATHTGDVTGDVALTIAAGAVDLAMLSATGTADGTTFLRGDNAWATVATGTPEGSAILSTGETIGKVLQADGDDSSSWVTLPGGGDALVANPLSQFAATTSAQLAGVLSDETGSGAAVFATSPTLVTPALGTPSALVATNATGTAAGLTVGATTGVEAGATADQTGAEIKIAYELEPNTNAFTDANVTTLGNQSGTNTGDQTNITGNAATVTTNANLTGHITSTGNAAILGSFTAAQLSTALSDASISGTNTGDQTLPASGVDFDPVGTDNSNNNAVNTLYSGLVSNANHTGDVTGSTALTIAVAAVDIPMLSATGTASGTTFLRGDNTWGTPAGGSGVALSEDVTQSNTFSVGDVIYHNGTSWLDANANTEVTAEALGIVESATGSDFTVILSGKITLTGLTAGTTYFLSDVTDALLTATEPTSIGSISKPVLYAISTTVGYVHNYRGIEIAGSSTTKGQLGITIDGAGSAITTGIKGDLRVPYDCTISNVEVVLDQIGSIVIDVWNDSYANYPAIDGDSITASAPPTVSSATKSRDSTLTGWTLALSAGDYLRFNVDSITTATRATLTLEVTKT
jgi:hypothetical protein